MRSHHRKLCKRCGKCCLVFNPTSCNKGFFADCKWLIRYQDGTTRCSIYAHRLGAKIGYEQYCQKREDVLQNWPDCPYNKIGYDTHPYYNEK